MGTAYAVREDLTMRLAARLDDLGTETAFAVSLAAVGAIAATLI